MAKYDPEWDRVVRAIQTHYRMYDKVREINIRYGVMALERI
jgi:ASC-1-like (ASCH) protein